MKPVRITIERGAVGGSRACIRGPRGGVLHRTRDRLTPDAARRDAAAWLRARPQLAPRPLAVTVTWDDGTREELAL